MNKKQEILAVIKEQGLLPLFYNDSPDTSEKLLHALYEGGVRILEYTNRGQYALENFKHLRKVVNSSYKDFKLGVGTVKSADDATKFIDAGAEFVICPLVNPEVATIVNKNGLLWVPGCFTNTEIYTAEVNGAELVKIFPGSIGGPSHISAIKEIFPELQFMPTGGVEASQENIKAWFKAGVYAVGMGSKLVSKTAMEQQQYTQLSALAKDILETIRVNRQ